MYTGKISSCAKRLSTALNIRSMRQSDLCEATRIPKSAVSQYVSGAFEPKQDRIYLMAKALKVNEAWLMGYDVPMDRQDDSLPSLNLQLFGSDEPNADNLTDKEKELLDLFRQVPEAQQQLVIQMVRAAVSK